VELGHGAAADGYDIAWPDCRYHASAGDLEANLAEAAGHVGDQLTT